MQSRSEAGSTGQNEEHGRGGFSLEDQKESSSRFISRRNTGDSMAREGNVPLCRLLGRLPREFHDIYGNSGFAKCSDPKAMQSRKSWQGNSGQRDRRGLYPSVRHRGEHALPVSGRPFGENRSERGQTKCEV